MSKLPFFTDIRVFFGAACDSHNQSLTLSLILSIADRIPSASDLLSFALVCRSFRAAASAISTPPGPPLLLSPVLSFLRPSHLPSWSEPFRSRLQTLTSPFRSYSSFIAPRTLIKRCVGCSHSHLIFFTGKVVLADPFISCGVILATPSPAEKSDPQSSLLRLVSITASSRHRRLPLPVSFFSSVRECEAAVFCAGVRAAAENG